MLVEKEEERRGQVSKETCRYFNYLTIQLILYRQNGAGPTRISQQDTRRSATWFLAIN